jgi:hypothetical protein
MCLCSAGHALQLWWDVVRYSVVATVLFLQRKAGAAAVSAGVGAAPRQTTNEVDDHKQQRIQVVATPHVLSHTPHTTHFYKRQSTAHGMVSACTAPVRRVWPKTHTKRSLETWPFHVPAPPTRHSSNAV